MGRSSKKYIEFKEDYLTHKKGTILRVDYPTADRLIADKKASKTTEAKFKDYHTKLAKERQEAKAEHIAKVKAEREAQAKKNECKDCGDDKPCEDCEDKESEKE